MLAAGEAGEQDMPQAHKGLGISSFTLHPLWKLKGHSLSVPRVVNLRHPCTASLQSRGAGAVALGVCEAEILLCPSWGLGPRNKALVTPGVLGHSSDHLEDVHWPLLDPLVGRREKCAMPCPLPPAPCPQKPGVIRETKKKRTEPRKTVLRAQKGAREEEGGFSGGILESLVIFLYPCVHFE